MSIWMLLLGFVLLGVVSYDALSTTLVASSPSGPLTERLGRGWWWLVRHLARGPHSLVLRWTGPLMMVFTVALWLLMLWAGWALIFAADPDSVLDATTRAPADGWSKVYFAAFSTFTLGVGDFVPSGAPWQVATSLATISGLALTTTAVTYFLPVVIAVTARRTQASSIARFGDTPQQIVIAGWHDGSFRFLASELNRLTAQILRTAERQLSYPILNYFHSEQREKDFRVQLRALDEAVTLLAHAVQPSYRPHPMVIDGVRHASRQITRHISPSGAQTVDPIDLTPLREAGVPTVDDASFTRDVASVTDHRRRVAAYSRESLWDDGV